MTKFVSNREIYEQVIRDRVPLAKKRLWIATADIKDMYIVAVAQQMQRTRGDIPAHLESVVRAALKPQIRWQEVLA